MAGFVKRGIENLVLKLSVCLSYKQDDVNKYFFLVGIEPTSVAFMD